MKVPLHALVVEDSEEDTWLLVRELKRGNYEVTYERVETAESFQQALASETWDIILCDFSLPRFSGQAALRIAKESGLDLPFIYVSGTIGEDVAVEAMKAGAHDYVMKNNLARLIPAVERELRDARERVQHRHAEEAMRVSEYKYRHLFENMSDAAFLIDEKSGRIIDTNRQAEVLLGRSRAEILGLNQELLFPTRNAGCLYAEGIRESYDLETEVVRMDGLVVPVHISASRVELYGRGFLLALLRDISERNRAEAQREQLTRDRFLILESTIEGIYGIDLKGCCTFMNHSAAKMLGYDVEEVLGKDMHSLIHSRWPDGSPFPVAECNIYRTLSHGVPCRIDSECFWRKDGTAFPVEYSASPIIENDAVKGVVVAFSDLTEKNPPQARFFRAERLENI
jgi:two-component system cell cycle sensor histidine kinase/response regulator CckA